ncbi:MAG TPA: maleylpyruvate isomerase family mycothiol-dependent enzyme [Acidimicrobiia bacterium]|nr:maleylpyruvate isomerase family mycothiol-dependent enzyme [Acidimicrobiia bacterium]
MSSTALVTDGSTVHPIGREEAMDLAAAEYERLLDVLRALSPEEWRAPTECPGWDVRAMASHVLGSAESHASLRELAHQLRGAARAGGNFVDGVTATQVRDRAGSSPRSARETG